MRDLYEMHSNSFLFCCRFASSGSSMLDCKAKILMDLSLDRDIDKALLDNVESGAFDLYMGPRKRYEFTNEYMLRTEGTNT